MIETLGGRKFIFAVLISIGLFVLAIIGKIEFDQLQQGLLWALAIFSAANAGQKIAKAM